MSVSWFRSWHGAPTDNKWLLVAREAGVPPGIVSAMVWALFDHASQSSDRGNVSDFDIEVYACFSGFDVTQCNAVKRALVSRGVIRDGYLANWEKRQPKREDDSSSRVKKFRENQSDKHLKRNVTQCNAPDTDTDTDTEKKEEVESPHEEVSDAVSIYNTEADRIGLPLCQKLTTARKQKLSARLRDCGGIEGWRAALQKLSQSAFCLGSNDRGWKADIDFLLQESSFVKLMEGKYDGKPKGKSDKNLERLREWVES